MSLKESIISGFCAPLIIKSEVTHKNRIQIKTVRHTDVYSNTIRKKLDGLKNLLILINWFIALIPF